MSSKNKIIGFIFTTLFAFSNNLFSMDDPYRLDLSTSSHNPYVLHLSLPGPPSSGGQLSVQCSFARTRQPRPIYVTVPQEIEERLVEHQKLLKAQQNQREINAAQDLHRKILREGGEPQIINLSNGERMLVGLELKRKKEKYETPFLTPPPTTQLDQTETMPPTSQFFGFEPTSEDEYTMTPVFLTDDTREERKSSAQETQDFSLRPRSLLTCNHPMFNGPTMEYRPITTQTEESENIDSVEAAREAGVSVINQPLIATPTQPQERKNESRRGNPQRTSRKRRPGDDRTSVGHDATTPSKKPYHEEEIPATQSDTFRVEEGDIDSLATAEFDLDGDSNEETMGTKPQTIEDDEGNGSDETKNESQQRKRDGSLLDIIPTAAKRACIRAIASSAYTCADLLFNPP